MIYILIDLYIYKIIRIHFENISIDFITMSVFLYPDVTQWTLLKHFVGVLFTNKVGTWPGRLRGLTGRAFDRRSQPHEFEPRPEHIWRVFHLWLRFIIFGGRSTHLAYHVHKSLHHHQSLTSFDETPIN